MPIFPPEIIDNSVETHFVKNNIRSKVLYISVLVALVLFVASMPFIVIDISTQARGIIRTPNENNQLQSVVYAQVEQIFIHENKEVKTGDVLLILKSNKIKEQIQMQQKKINDNNLFVSDINNLLKKQGNKVRTPLYKNEYNYFRVSANEQQTKVLYYRQEWEVAKQLFDKDVISKKEYLQHKNNYDIALDQQHNIAEQFYNKWQNKKTSLLLENKEINSNILQLAEEQKKYIIKSPCNGSIIQFSGIQIGNFVSPSQTIAYVSANDNLLVECYVSPTDIGYISINQDIKFQLDAFNYNQWGMATGVVQEISEDISTINNKPVFKVRCLLHNKYLSLNTGYKGYLKKGMTLTGRFYLTNRTLWQLLFDKINDWVNPKLVLK